MFSSPSQRGPRGPFGNPGGFGSPASLSSVSSAGSPFKGPRPNKGTDRPTLELDPEMLEGFATLLDYVDHKVMVNLRDGKIFLGHLRTVDQFNNLMLTGAVERIHVENSFGDVPRGVAIVRGDNLVMIGEVDEERDANSRMQRVDVAEILSLQKESLQGLEEREHRRVEGFKERGLSYIPRKCQDLAVLRMNEDLFHAE